LGLPPIYSNPDGTPWSGQVNGYITGKYTYLNHEEIMLGVLAIYEGHKDFGLELLYRDHEVGFCRNGYQWDGVNCCSAFGDTGVMNYGWDYWFNWCVWTAAAALKGGDFSILTKPGGLVDRMKEAAKAA
jgi:hypothetical protein